VFSNEALSRILTEADRIVYDAQSLLDKAVATGEDELVEAARNNLRLVIENRDRLNKVFSLTLASAHVEN
jgi:DNA polymerase III gamma/tau subunit